MALKHYHIFGKGQAIIDEAGAFPWGSHEGLHLWQDTESPGESNSPGMGPSQEGKRGW